MCDRCHKRFSRKDILMRHIRRQHEPNTGVSKRQDRVESSDLIVIQHQPSVTSDTTVADLPTATSLTSLLTTVPDANQNQPVAHRSPMFSDNTGSPEAILGQPNALASQLLNEDLMNWLLSREATPGLEFPSEKLARPVSQSATPFLPELIPPFLGNTGESVDDVAGSSHSTFPCTWATCERIRQAMDLESSSLVDKFICPSFVSYAVDIYWTLHMRWPILHRPTFSVNDCPTYLLVAIITVSMYLCQDPDALQLAIDLHEVLRYKVYSHPAFKTQTALWTLQTLLLAEIFEKMCSNEEQHEMSARFHNVLISSMRSAAWKNPVDDSGQDPEWGKFIYHESRKRVAFFAFVVDTQHTAMFGHAPSMFISDLNFRLPCEEALWEAPDASSWRRLRSELTEPRADFAAILGSFLRLDGALPVLSPWGMMIVLHGLISVGWNMRLRQQTLPDMSDGRNSKWAEWIADAYSAWLRHYRDTFLTNSTLSFNHPYVLGCLTTYELAHVVLNVDVKDCENFLKALVSGSNGGSRSEQLARTIADEFLSTRATQAVGHALDLIEMFIMGDTKYDVSAETAFHRAYCLYMSALTVWVFHYVFDITDRTHSSPRDMTESLWRQAGKKSDFQIKMHLATDIGRMRGVLSKIDPKAQREKLAEGPLAGLLLNANSAGLCGANELLRHVVDILRPCRWQLSK